MDARIREMNESAAAAAGKGKAKHVTTAYYFDHYATAEDLDVVVEERDFIAAQRELVPSVSASELAHYERVRATFEGQRSADAAAAGNGVQPQASTLPNGGGGVPRLAARFLTASGGQSAAAGAVGSGATGDGTGKGKGKESSVGKGKEIAVGKGKSKAVTPPVAGDESDYADEDEDGIRGARDMGKGKGKGKGKAVDGDWFEHHSDGDDDGLY